MRTQIGAAVSLGLCLLAGRPLPAAQVSGRVELLDSRESAVSRKQNYSGVVVWLDPINAPLAPVGAPVHARMIQKDKTFTPHVLAVRAGTTIDFPNFDPIFHNAFSNYNGKIFDVGLYPPGSSRSVEFSKPGVVRVFCNIHSTMSALILVLNTPYFDTTKTDGAFHFPDVPPGDYRLQLFHERATQATLDRASRRIQVTSEPLTLVAIPISESGYLPIPHKNKYGRDYPDEPDDPGIYPATRK